MNLQTKIVFVYSHLQSFVKEDLQILRSLYSVKQQQFLLKKRPLTFLYGQFKGTLEVFLNTRKADVVYIWFCDYHAFWSVLVARFWGKKSVIVVGGFDAVRVPSIDYGIFMKNNLRTRLAKYAYQKCDRIIAVDSSLIKGENTYAGEGTVTGVAHFVEGIEHKAEVIPTGYDENKWQMKPKKQQVLTIALIKDKKVFQRKGIDLYLEVAKRMPEVPFYLIGLQDKDLIPPHLQNLPNVEIIPILPQEELIQFYAETKVYCQFSLSEGLPNVLCEAMMSGCIPVGSSANGIPEAIGDCGFILKEPNVEKAVAYVQQALQGEEEQGQKCRERILQKFPKQNRKKHIFELINSMV